MPYFDIFRLSISKYQSMARKLLSLGIILHANPSLEPVRMNSLPATIQDLISQNEEPPSIAET